MHVYWPGRRFAIKASMFALLIYLMSIVAAVHSVSQPATALAATATIVISGSGANPETITTTVDSAVQWRNTDDIIHHLISSDSSFATITLGPGDTSTPMMLPSGVHRYTIDNVANTMASIIVSGSDASVTATPTPSATETSPMVSATTSPTVQTTSTATPTLIQTSTATAVPAFTATTVATVTSTVSPALTSVASPSPSATTPANTTRATIAGGMVSPITLTIAPGTYAQWVNDESFPVTITSSLFTTDAIASHSISKRLSFSYSGSYPYTVAGEQHVITGYVVVAPKTATPVATVTPTATTEPTPTALSSDASPTAAPSSTMALATVTALPMATDLPTPTSIGVGTPRDTTTPVNTTPTSRATSTVVPSVSATVTPLPSIIVTTATPYSTASPSTPFPTITLTSTPLPTPSATSVVLSPPSLTPTSTTTPETIAADPGATATPPPATTPPGAMAAPPSTPTVTSPPSPTPVDARPTTATLTSRPIATPLALTIPSSPSTTPTSSMKAILPYTATQTATALVRSGSAAGGHSTPLARPTTHPTALLKSVGRTTSLPRIIVKGVIGRGSTRLVLMLDVATPFRGALLHGHLSLTTARSRIFLKGLFVGQAMFVAHNTLLRGTVGAERMTLTIRIMAKSRTSSIVVAIPRRHYRVSSPFYGKLEIRHTIVVKLPGGRQPATPTATPRPLRH